MEFESPDVEKDFPGLYASESMRRCNESDCEENTDKSFKKDLIIGKRKEKKDSKKDRGYAALEGESSPDDEVDSKSPCKSKKSKSFKFSTKKSEKREKSREKDVEKKEKEVNKDKKEKTKHKEKKKVKSNDETEDYNIFGVQLSKAVERNGCLDGVPIPLVVRNCIDCIHSFGMLTDGLYKIMGVKSKVQNLKKAYNCREHVSLGECDVFAATCLLKTFLKELPEPILTNDLLTRFEEAGAIMEMDARENKLQELIGQLPNENRVLLGWLIIHFDTITMHKKHNKLNAQSIAMTFSPVLQMSHRLLTALLCHCKALFPNVIIERYVPPLCPASSFPETPEEIALELKKQEFLLSQIHREISEGFVSKKKEEQLWEVQRVVTQLKRKLRSLQRFQEAKSTTHRSLDDPPQNEEVSNEPKQQVVEKDSAQSKQTDIKVATNGKTKIENEEDSISAPVDTESQVEANPEDSNEADSASIKSTAEKPVRNGNNKLVLMESEINDLKEQLEYRELLKFQNLLKTRINKEKDFISLLCAKIQSYGNTTPPPPPPPSDNPDSDVIIEKLEKDYRTLQSKLKNLTKRIFEERLACIKLKVYIDILEMPEKES